MALNFKDAINRIVSKAKPNTEKVAKPVNEIKTTAPLREQSPRKQQAINSVQQKQEAANQVQSMLPENATPDKPKKEVDGPNNPRLQNRTEQKQAEQYEAPIPTFATVASPGATSHNLAPANEMSDWYKNHEKEPGRERNLFERVFMDSPVVEKVVGGGIGSKTSTDDMDNRTDRVRIKNADMSNMGYEDPDASQWDKIVGPAVNVAEAVNTGYMNLRDLRRNTMTEDRQRFRRANGSEYEIPDFTNIANEFADFANSQDPNADTLNQVIMNDGSIVLMTNDEFRESLVDDYQGHWIIPDSDIVLDTEGNLVSGNVLKIPEWWTEFEPNVPEGITYDDFVSAIRGEDENVGEAGEGLFKSNPEVFKYNEDNTGIIPDEVNWGDLPAALFDGLLSSAPYWSPATLAPLVASRMLISSQGVDPDTYDPQYDDYRNPGNQTADSYYSRIVGEPLLAASENALGAGTNVFGKPLINAIKKTTLPNWAKRAGIIGIDSVGEGGEEVAQAPLEEAMMKGSRNIFADPIDSDEYGNPIYESIPVDQRQINYIQQIPDNAILGFGLGAGVGAIRDLKKYKTDKKYGIDPNADLTNRPRTYVTPDQLRLPTPYSEGLTYWDRRNYGSEE